MADFGGILSGIGTLAGAAGDIYGLTQSAPDQFNKKKNPYSGLISTPGFTFGGGLLASTNNNQVQQGLAQQRGQISDLQGQVQPGYGKLTEAGVNAIRQQGAQASGNLRAQLAARGLSGASFAQDQLASVANQYSQLENEFRTQAFTQELDATTKLIDQQHTNLAAQATNELSQLQIATNFLAGVPQIAQTQKTIDAALAQKALIQKYQNPPQPANPTAKTKAA